MASIEDLIAKTNQVLKDGRCGLAIELCQRTLRLRGTLPPKPGSGKTEPHQQRVSLGYLANPAGIKRAEADAKKIAAQLIHREFNWHDWAEIYSPDTATIGEILDKLKIDYCAKNSATSWQNYWDAAYKWLPQNDRLTMKAITPALSRSPKDTRSRQVAFNAIVILLKFADMDFDLEPYRSTYTHASLNPKDIPSDDVIAHWHSKIPIAHWRWAYGIFATYGLRNHEIFHLEFEFPNVRVTEGKTGSRLVYPVHPEWVKDFDLQNIVPPTTIRKTHKAQGSAVGFYFRSMGLPFSIYFLRHAWAIRNVSYGFPDTISAIAMGHSVKVHTQTYQRWLGERDMSAVFQRIVSSPSRPTAPILFLQDQG